MKSRGPENPFIKLNFRGTKKIIRKDTLEPLPFLYALVDREWSENNVCDDEGYYMVDESSSVTLYLCDLFRSWLELGRPSALGEIHLPGHCATRGLFASVARRMGCETDFVEAILKAEKKVPDESKLFNCYYCGKTFLEDERETRKECRYHGEGCNCRDPTRTNALACCARVPFHTPKKLKIAKDRFPRDL